MLRLKAPVVLEDVVHTDLHAARLSKDSSLSFGSIERPYKAHDYGLAKCCGRCYHFIAPPIFRFGQEPGASEVVHWPSLSMS
jgi:hypothetical protein